MSDIYVHHYELVLRTILCSLIYLSIIKMFLFIEFRVNTKYGNQISMI
jgi:hypothetical protein